MRLRWGEGGALLGFSRDGSGAGQEGRLGRYKYFLVREVAHGGQGPQFGTVIPPLCPQPVIDRIRIRSAPRNIPRIRDVLLPHTKDPTKEEPRLRREIHPPVVNPVVGVLNLGSDREVTDPLIVSRSPVADPTTKKTTHQERPNQAVPPREQSVEALERHLEDRREQRRPIRHRQQVDRQRIQHKVHGVVHDDHEPYTKERRRSLEGSRATMPDPR